MQYNQKTETDNAKKYLRSARKAILGRGGEISLTAGLKDLPDAIYKIPADASLAYQVDDSVAYQKIVPTGAEEFAQVSKIGGMTYKCNNLFDKSKASNVTITETGVSFTNTKSDGNPTSIGLFKDLCPNVKVGDSITFYVDTVNAWKYPNGFIYIGGANMHSGTFYTVTEAMLNAQLNLYGVLNVVCEYNNLIITTVANAPYEPFFDGLRDTKVTELKSEGANLLNTMAEITLPSDTTINTTKVARRFTPNTMILGMCYNNYYNPTKASILNRTKDSVTFINASGYGLSFAFDLKPNTQYSISCTSSINTQQIGIALYNDDDTFDSYSVVQSYHRTFTTNQSGKTLIVFTDSKASSSTTEVTISNIMLNEGATELPYTEYKGTIDTFAIPEEIQALDGYGMGVNETYYNYIDYDRKVFVQSVSPFVFKGNEQWQKNAEAGDYWSFYLSTSYYSNYLGSDSMTTSVHICNKFPSTSWKDTKQGEFAWWAKASVGIRLHKSRLPNYENLTDNANKLNAFKEWLKSQYDSGNPVIWLWALANPIETDISEYLTDNFIEVEGGGTITAVNEFEQDAPSTINYIAKVGV